MASTSNAPVFLNSRETFEKYERRSLSPQSPPRTSFGSATQFQQLSPVVPHRAYQFESTEHFATERPSTTQTKIASFLERADGKKVPIGWIVGIAIGIPIFVILVLFAAVWLQELGII